MSQRAQSGILESPRRFWSRVAWFRARVGNCYKIFVNPESSELLVKQRRDLEFPKFAHPANRHTAKPARNSVKLYPDTQDTPKNTLEQIRWMQRSLKEVEAPWDRGVEVPSM